jgi:hypothetical protein
MSFTVKTGNTYSSSVLSALGSGIIYRFSGVMVIALRRFSLQQEGILGRLFFAEVVILAC